MNRRLALAAVFGLVPAVALASGGEKKKGGGLSFIQIRAVMATIMRRDGTRGVITVECGIDVANERLREKANASQPRLRAAYAAFVQTYAAGMPASALPDADYLSRELQRVTDQTLGAKGAKFLLGTILIN